MKKFEIRMSRRIRIPGGTCSAHLEGEDTGYVFGDGSEIGICDVRINLIEPKTGELISEFEEAFALSDTNVISRKGIICPAQLIRYDEGKSIEIVLLNRTADDIVLNEAELVGYAIVL